MWLIVSNTAILDQMDNNFHYICSSLENINTFSDAVYVLRCPLKMIG